LISPVGTLPEGKLLVKAPQADWDGNDYMDARTANICRDVVSGMKQVGNRVAIAVFVFSELILRALDFSFGIPASAMEAV
jgi:hypothetical protein